MESFTDVYNFSIDASLENWPEKVVIAYLTRAMRLIWFSITFILGTVGNGLVIWITGFKMRKTVAIIWFLNLAVANFFFCLILPLTITETALGDHWPFGQITCKVTTFIQCLNQFVSAFFLTMISIDRCICVLYPIWSQNYRTSRLAKIISVIIWLFSVALSSPYILSFYNIHDGNFSECILTNAAGEDMATIDDDIFILRYQAMVITGFVTTFLIPFPIILVCYGLIMLRLRRRGRIPGSTRTLKIIITTVLCFFICWFLYQVLLMIDIEEVHIQEPVSEIVYSLAFCLAVFNSCLNPIIYVFIGRDFQQTLKKSIPFLLENAFKERNEPMEMLEDSNVL